MQWSRLLPQVLTELTRCPRYKPEKQPSSGMWTIEFFRLYESIFWRRGGEQAIRREGTLQYGLLPDGRQFERFYPHTWEAFFASGEAALRRALAPVPGLQRARVPYLVPVGMPGIILPGLSNFLFAVARDSSTTFPSAGAASSQTVSTLTITGSNTFLIAAMLSRVASLDVISSVTWDSGACTRLQGDTSNVNFRSTYYKIGPNTGNKNFVINFSPTDSNAGVLASYSGVSSGALDNSATNSSAGTSFTDSITPVAANCWALLSFVNIDNGNGGAGTGANINVAKTSEGNQTIFDSNGTITGGSSYSMTVTASGTSRNMMRTLATIAPLLPPIITSPFFKKQAPNRASTY